MLIDDFLPEYQFSKEHRLTIDAPADIVYENLMTINMAASSIIKILFKIRGLPEAMMTLPGMQKIGFTHLGEIPGREFLLGLAGRFWTLNGDLRALDPASFKTFRKAGFAKAAWNFSLNETGKNRTVIKTETRIQCLDKKSYRRFRLYWLLVGPFSSLIRKRILVIVKKQTESSRYS